MPIEEIQCMSLLVTLECSIKQHIHNVKTDFNEQTHSNTDYREETIPHD